MEEVSTLKSNHIKSNMHMGETIRELEQRAETAEKELAALHQYRAPVAVPDGKPAVLTGKLIDWVCLTCVDVRNAAGYFEAQDSINEIRSTLESLQIAVPDKHYDADGTASSEADMVWNSCIDEVLRLNSGSTPYVD
ncbi:hypothetical protein BTJ39_23180 [Izhakiella australiensis]|uniref:Uncharacterized protein n=2 Tax=Izhakiella australiensis TaxID=1926881 RepID=A0A1S8Y6V4_9GAMM|nr:hypothetical protein BTJ39_23180 [Izhakiella australiensis]